MEGEEEELLRGDCELFMELQSANAVGGTRESFSYQNPMDICSHQQFRYVDFAYADI